MSDIPKSQLVLGHASPPQATPHQGTEHRSLCRGCVCGQVVRQAEFSPCVVSFRSMFRCCFSIAQTSPLEGFLERMMHQEGPGDVTLNAVTPQHEGSAL